MISLSNYINEKLVINKHTQISKPKFELSEDSLPTNLLSLSLSWHKHDITSSNVNNTLDDDDWHRSLKISTVKVKKFSRDPKEYECWIEFWWTGSGWQGTADICKDESFIWTYSIKRGGFSSEPNYELTLIFNPYYLGTDYAIKRLIELYKRNEITKYSDHFAFFKLDINEILKLFDIDLKMFPDNIHNKYEGNYAIKMYKTEEYKQLKELLNNK